MKKILIAVAFCFILSNCEIKTRSANAYNSVEIEACTKIVTYEKDGLTYLVVTSGCTGAVGSIICHTKEQLEVKLLRKQLDSTNRK